jgi:hypothetical protein
VETLTKILEKIGEHYVRVGWMYGVPIYPRLPVSPRPPYQPRPRQEDR